MARHVLLVEEPAGLPLEAALPAGWRVTKVEEGQLALAWLRHNPPDLVLVGRSLADLTPSLFVRSVKLDHAASVLPLVQLGEEAAVPQLRAEPDAWLDPAEPGLLACAVGEALAASAERHRDGVRGEVRLRLPSHPDQLELLSDLIAPWLGACGFGPQSRMHLGLAVRELVANAIEWGHRNDRSRAVLVHARLDHEKVSVLVSDSGPGFDPRHLPHAASPGDPLSHMEVRSALSLREGGFGILMTRGLVDHLCYNEAGNEAQVIKYLPSRHRGQRTEDRGQRAAVS